MVNSQLSDIQGFGMLIQLAKIWKKIYRFYEVFQKQMHNAHVFIHHVVVLLATTSIAVIFPHVGAITVEAS
jgi:hypothetical protein